MPGPIERASEPTRTGAAERFEWVLARFLVAARLAAVLQVLADVGAGRGQLRRPRLAAAMGGLSVLHAGLAITRTLRQRRIGDPLVAASEIPFGIALLGVEALAYDPSAVGASTGPRLGTDYVGVAAGFAAAELSSPSAIFASIAALGAVKIAIAARTRDRGSVTLQSTLFDLLVMAEGMMGHVVVTQIRDKAAALDRAHERETRETSRLAGEREQLRHHRLVHDRVLQTLEVIAGGWELDDEHIRQRLLLESAQLEDLIQDKGALSSSDLLVALLALGREFSLRDLQVELRSDLDEVVLTRSLLDGLLGASREALANVCKHAGVHRAELTVGTEGKWLVVTITDAGRGFEPSAVDGFGLTESVHARLGEIGGEATVTSTLGAGTTLVLRVPR